MSSWLVNIPPKLNSAINTLVLCTFSMKVPSIIFFKWRQFWASAFKEMFVIVIAVSPVWKMIFTEHYLHIMSLDSAYPWLFSYFLYQSITFDSNVIANTITYQFFFSWKVLDKVCSEYQMPLWSVWITELQITVGDHAFFSLINYTYWSIITIILFNEWYVDWTTSSISELYVILRAI